MKKTLFISAVLLFACSESNNNNGDESSSSVLFPSISSSSVSSAYSSSETSSSASSSSEAVDVSDDSSSSEETAATSSSSSVNFSSSSATSNATSSSSILSSSSSFAPPPAAESYPTLKEGQAGVQKGWTSRYWDGCKPSCSWPEKNQNLVPWAICRNCDKDDKEMSTYYMDPNSNPPWYVGYIGTKSSCDEGGVAYTCWDMAPIAINDTLAYAFAATPGSGDQCGKCYQIQFDGGWNDAAARVTHIALKGKTLIVMASNIGHDVGSGQFDILIPGGGVGAFDSFSKQLSINIDDLGGRMGGLLTTCDQQIDGWNATLEQWQTCLRNKCNAVFGSKSKLLLDGCLWQANWYMAANNPTILYKETECPKYLVDKYKSTIDTSPPPSN